MPENITRITVFISYPGDVQSEMEIVRRICERLTEEFTSRNVEVVAKEWRSDVSPSITGEGAQAIINSQIGEYDIYVGLLWARFGDQQANGLTPTEEEFEDAVIRKKEMGKPLITFYFKGDASNPSTPYEEHQAQEILRFKERIRDLGLYAEFNGMEDFEEKILRNLRYFVDQFDSLTFRASPIPKIKYDEIPYYIPRKLYPPGEDSTFISLLGNETRHSAIKVIEEKRRVVFLAGGGVGKSTELRYLSAYYSNPDLPLYPYIVPLNKYTNQSISKLLPSDCTEIPESNLLILLDGLDEIESKNKKDAIRQIESFAAAHPNVHIVVSCRTNFYKSQTQDWPGTLEGFTSYLLLDLDRESIDKYVKGRIGVFATKFYEEIYSNRLRDLLGIPFYLTHLVELFQVDHRLPWSKSALFEQLLNVRVRGDIEHFRTTIDLDEKRKLVITTLERLALGMEMLGRNYVTEDELGDLVPYEEERELLKFSGSFRRSEGEITSWQFEHNNFQEYLAARVLARQSLETIKSLVSFGPEHTTIVPSWVNTLSFLAGILDKEDPLFKELMDWIIKIESSVVTKFEADKVQLELRVGILKSIFDYYKEKGIRINRERFDYEELARFGESDETILFLLNEIENGTDVALLTSALSLLMGMRIPEKLRKRTQDLLVKCILSTRDEIVQNRGLLALAELNFQSEEAIAEVVPALRASESDWVRYGLYYFLHTGPYLDDYIDVFLEGIPYLQTHRFAGFGSRAKSRLGNESSELNIGLQKAISAEAIRKILEHFMQYPNVWGDAYITMQSSRTLPDIVEHAAVAYQSDSTVFYFVVNLFKVLIQEHLIGAARVVVTFFDKTNTRLRAFQTIDDEMGLQRSSIPILAPLANEQVVEAFFELYDHGRVDDSGLNYFINMLGSNEPIHDYMERRLQEKYPEKVIHAQVPDFAAARKERKQRDIALLFDKDGFIKELQLVFETQGETILTSDELLEIRVHDWENRRYPEMVLQTLSDLAALLPVSLEKTIQDMKDRDWDWFIISRLYELLHQEDVTLLEEQEEFIRRWCLNQLDKVNFRTALVTKSDGGFSASWRAIYLSYFLRQFQLDYPKSVLLDMLSFSLGEEPPPSAFGYLEQRLDPADISSRVLENLEQGIQNDIVLKKHFVYAHQHMLKEVLPFALNEVANEKRSFDARRIALETFVGLEGPLSGLEDVVDRVADDFRWLIVEELLKSSSERLRAFLQDVLAKNDEEEQLKAARLLLRLQDVAGLQYYVDWIKKHKKIPVEPAVISPLIGVQNPDAMPLLLELLHMSYAEEVQQDDFARLDESVLTALRNIALLSDSGFLIVKKELQNFISQFSSLKGVKYLYIFLENLENQLEVNKSFRWTVQEATVRLNEIFAK